MVDGKINNDQIGFAKTKAQAILNYLAGTAPTQEISNSYLLIANQVYSDTVELEGYHDAVVRDRDQKIKNLEEKLKECQILVNVASDLLEYLKGLSQADKSVLYDCYDHPGTYLAKLIDYVENMRTKLVGLAKQVKKTVK